VHALVVACGLAAAHTPAATEAKAAEPPITSVPVSGDDAAILQSLQTMFDTHVPALPVSGNVDRRDLYRSYARAALREDTFWDAVLPRLLRGSASRPDAFPFHLQHKRVNGTEIYWLPQDGSEPCTLRETVEVAPWWNVRERVRICRKSYAPEVKSDPRSGGRQFCESTYNQNPAGSPCRCGEYLVNCARDAAQAEAMQRAIQEEGFRTIQRVVQSNRPFTEILTTNETVRSNLADFVYRRAKFFETGKADFVPITADDRPTVRPREPRFGGGLLTTPEWRWADPAPRILIGVIWEDFLCVPFSSRNVDGHVLMKMTNASLRSKDHMELTTMTGCRDCHARLEYALRSFRTFSTTRDGWRLYSDTAPADELGRVYMWNADDFRAEGTPDPAWLGKTIGAQPEFAECMVDRVSKFVFRGPVPPTVRESAVARFKADKNFGGLFEDMLVARYASTPAPTPPKAP
jgi:hypothetical protein